jgi:hypothetical protein
MASSTPATRGTTVAQQEMENERAKGVSWRTRWMQCILVHCSSPGPANHCMKVFYWTWLSLGFLKNTKLFCMLQSWFKTLTR